MNTFSLTVIKHMLYTHTLNVLESKHVTKKNDYIYMLSRSHLCIMFYIYIQINRVNISII